MLIAAFPLLGVSSYFMSKILAAGTSENATWYAEAGAIAQQALSNIRTVVSFNGQDKVIAKYKNKIEHAETRGVRNQLAAAGTMASVWWIMFLCYALAFWYGSTLIVDGELTGGQVLNVC